MKRLKVIFLLALLAVASTALIRAQTTDSFTFTTNRIIPDGNSSGMSDVQTVTSAIGNITSLKVRLKVTGEFNGDLYGYLRHSSGFTVLLNRPGKTAANPAGYADSGFNVTFQDGAPNGDIHLYQSITKPTDGSPLTGIWQPDGRNVDPDAVSDASTRTSYLTNFNGLSAAGDWTLYLVDTQSGGTNMVTEWGLDITGEVTPVMTWPTPANIIYGTALSSTQLNATVTYNSTEVPGTFTYTPAAGTVLNAGPNQTLKVVFTPTDTSSYLPITNSVTINVQQAPVTVTVANTNKVYGQALPTFTASYSGFVLGEDTNSLASLATLTTAATQNSAAGTYPITASGAASQNYSFTFVAGTLTINQALSGGVVTSSANPALPGASVTFTATLNAVAPGAGSPDGMVNFRIDGVVAGSGTLSGGVATFTTSSLAHGSHTVSAEYAGSGNFVGTTNSLAQNQVINTPPTAGNDTIERYATGTVKVRITTLLANDSDADGDALTINISPLSANGGTITVSGGWAFYTPASGYTNTDSFTYTISDGMGGSVTATVTVAIKVDTTVVSANLVITSLGSNQYRIDGSGIPGRTYQLQYSDTLNPPTWQDIAGGSLTANDLGQFSYTDTSTGEVRIYRTVSP